MPIPTLHLPPNLTASKTVRYSTKEMQLGDGYTQVSGVGKTDGQEEWAIQSDWLLTSEMNSLVGQLSFLRGAEAFSWTPNGAERGKVYVCDRFEVIRQGLLQQLQATFVELLEGECEPYRTEVLKGEEILGFIEGMKSWIQRYTRDQKPFIINSAFLMTNSFHDVLGRGAYFTFQSATTEGQFVAIRAAMYAFEVTGDPYWRDLAINMAAAAIQYLYPIKPFPPVNWQTLDENNISVAHWLCNLEPVPSKAPVADDPLNYGYFYLVVNFTNGVGQIPYGAPTFGEKLANVYRVIPMNEELLWQNVYAFPRYNPQSAYEIDYWVTDVCLKGLIRRFYSDAQQPGGRQPLPTNEPVGLVKLVQPFTGQLKVIFSTYTGEILQANDLYEPYPMWRKLRPGEALAAIDVFAWSFEAYKKLWEATGDQFWYRCMFYTGLTEIRAAQIENSSCWYKKYNAADPFRHPGSQVIVTPSNDTRTYVAARNHGGDKDLWMRLDLSASSAPFPSVEIQNFAVQPAVDSQTIVQVEAACSQPTTLEIVLSLSQNAFDFTQYYIARMPVVGSNTAAFRNFSNKEFLKFNPAVNIWNPFIADNPVYSYSGLNGTVSATLQSAVIEGVPRDVFRIDLWGKGGFSGAGFVTRGIAPDLASANPTLPFSVYCKLEDINGSGIQLKVTVNGTEYFSDLPDGGFDWAVKRVEANNLILTGQPDKHPPADGVVTNIEVQGIGVQRGVFSIWYIGGAPEQLPSYAQVFKAAVVSKIKTAHTLWCGNFEAIGAPTNELRYVPGVNLFTVNVENSAVDSWRGAVVMAGYQDIYHLVLTEQWIRLGNQLDFLTDSQNEFQRVNPDKINGFFYQGFALAYWDAVDFIDNRGYNVFVDSTIDPNNEWTQYHTRPLHSVAKGWHLLVKKGMGKTKYGKQCERITMRFLGYLFTFFRQRNSNQPPTNITPSRGAEVFYHEPATASLILRGAIYANLAGGNRLITFGVIKAMYEYIKSQYTATGNMSGSFTVGQPEFFVDGVAYKENFGFWTAEILESLAILYRYRDEIKLPSCSSPLI